MAFSIALGKNQKIRNFEELYSQDKTILSYPKIGSKFISNGGGTYSFFKLLSQSCKWTACLAQKLCWNPDNINTIFKTGKKFHFISRNLILTKIPHNLVELDKSYEDYKIANDKEVIRKRDALARKITETIADVSFLFQLGDLLALYNLGTILSPAVQFAGSLFLIFQNILGLKMEAEDFIDHRQMRNEVDNQKNPISRVKKILHEIRNLDLLRLAKSITTLAVAYLFLYELIFQVVLVSSTTVLCMATVSTVIAIWTHFYQESMTYQLIKK